MWARPEQTQLEDLSYASFLGKLLVFPANFRLDWKVIDRYKHSSIFGLVISNEGKKFHDIDTRRINYRRKKCYSIDTRSTTGWIVLFVIVVAVPKETRQA